MEHIRSIEEVEDDELAQLTRETLARCDRGLRETLKDLLTAKPEGAKARVPEKGV